MQCSHVTIVTIVARLGVVSERHDLFVHLMNDGPYKITVAQGFMGLIILTCKTNSPHTLVHLFQTFGEVHDTIFISIIILIIMILPCI